MAHRSWLALTLLLPTFVACSAVEDVETDTSEISTPACLPTPACAAPSGPAVADRRWRHRLKASAVTKLGSPNHRGRDVFVNPGQPQLILGKFAYGKTDKDLEDEEVDVFVQRDCGAGWEKLGTAITTTDKEGPDGVEGIPRGNGRIYFQIPKDKELGPGRHHVRLVVAGDGSSTDVFVDVVPPKTPIFVSDVDGTLTSSENVEFAKLLTGDIPDTHAGAPEALRALVAKGYRPVYITARPEWLTQRTREFLDKHGFPPGIVRTSTSLTGAGFGSNAAEFKEREIAELARKGLVPSFGFGNKASDAEAYATIPVKDHRIFLKLDEAVAGRRIRSYTELLPDFAQLPAACE